MHIPLSTITTFYILLDFADVTIIAHNRDELDLMFRQRTRSEWEKAWHEESHSRCREKLVKHLYWACEKDIYRISRRSDQGLKPTPKQASITLPWLDDASAKTMLRTRRSRRRITGSGSSITSECCTKTGCTWEEYAEYCPSNKRIITVTK
ncbi:putative insulin-like peptide 7 [Pseudolycoriella hygida]|uniref:Insulin-like peptide 7 n=1 Tax=Pseudolycoriella hygida TaxID=35572 RepID=A0A9Q0MSD5_9DIPT|nr:putative insulin-like peptide 7 [Pseudolycoriella hygida]